jgi:hypothetical protein
MTDYKKLEIDIKALKESLSDRLLEKSKAFVDELLESGEYGVAFEEITFALIDSNKPVPLEIVQKIEILAKEMKIPDDNWKPIKAI